LISLNLSCRFYKRVVSETKLHYIVDERGDS